MNLQSDSLIPFGVFVFRIVTAILLWGILSITTDQPKHWKFGLLFCMITVGVAGFGTYIKEIVEYTSLISTGGVFVMLTCVFIMYLVKKTTILNSNKLNFKLVQPTLIGMAIVFLLSLLSVPLILILNNQNKTIAYSKNGLKTDEHIVNLLDQHSSQLQILSKLIAETSAEQKRSIVERNIIIRDNKKILLILNETQKSTSKEKLKIRKKKLKDEYVDRKNNIKEIDKIVHKQKNNWFQDRYEKIMYKKDVGESTKLTDL